MAPRSGVGDGHPGRHVERGRRGHRANARLHTLVAEATCSATSSRRLVDQSLAWRCQPLPIVGRRLEASPDFHYGTANSARVRAPEAPSLPASQLPAARNCSTKLCGMRPRGETFILLALAHARTACGL